jgi:serine/threonine protein phosphatase 1
MRLLAIGDIHGCLRAFETLLDSVAPDPKDWIITLGDYVDRGPDSRGVLQRLLQLSRGSRLVAIRGNHEEMMLDVRENATLFPAWLQYGGRDTLDSYAVDGRPGTLADIPPTHWNFLDHQCVDWFESEKHFFVHANADPNLALPDQPPSMLRWQKFANTPPHRSGKTMICGHTYQENGLPRNIGHAVCIDTWVYGAAGWLTCLDVGSGQFWQANQRGESRSGNIGDLLENVTAARPS